MTTQPSHQKLTNLQLALLKVFRYELPEQDLLNIQELLAHYFAQRATDDMETFWDTHALTEETMVAWLHDHHRTPYT